MLRLMIAAVQTPQCSGFLLHRMLRGVVFLWDIFHVTQPLHGVLRIQRPLDTSSVRYFVTPSGTTCKASEAMLWIWLRGKQRFKCRTVPYKAGRLFRHRHKRRAPLIPEW